MSDPSNSDYYPTDPQYPVGDWASFYGRINQDNSIITDPLQRMGVLPGYREEPLQEPYIVWDSRDIALGDTVLTNHGTAGSVFDLKIGSEADEGTHPTNMLIPFWYVYGYKTLNWDNDYATTPDPPGGFPSGEDDIGGDTCSGAYTMMVAFSPGFKKETLIEAEQEARGTNNPDGYMYVEIDFLSNFDAADGGGTNLRQNTLGDNSPSSSSGPNLDSDIFWEWYDAYNYMQWLSQSPSPTLDPFPDTGFQLGGKLLTTTVDPWSGQCWVWLDDQLIRFYDTWGDYEPPGTEDLQFNFLDWVAPCSDNPSGLNPGTFKELFLYFYGHEGDGFYRDHAAWETVIGTAFFRGMPTREDLDEWKAFFYPPGQEYQTKGLNYQINRGSVPQTSAYSDTFVVPDNGFDPENGLYPVTYLVMNLSPASGGSQGGINITTGNAIWCKFAVDPGDEIYVELGGGGAVVRSTGLGGWPDGGNGGLSATSGLWGAGGGGSTKIYRNGSLYIHMPGGGGGADDNVGGTTSLANAGSRVSKPETEGYSLPVHPDGGGVLAGAGATTSAPGAGGSNGGGAGSGSNGGTGTTTSIATWTGGGGGGGGFYGGGGGGAQIGNLSYGGGAGSWYVHGAVEIYNTTPIGSGFISSAGASAFVDIYYW